ACASSCLCISLAGWPAPVPLHRRLRGVPLAATSFRQRRGGVALLAVLAALPAAAAAKRATAGLDKSFGTAGKLLLSGKLAQAPTFKFLTGGDNRLAPEIVPLPRNASRAPAGTGPASRRRKDRWGVRSSFIPRTK